MARLAHALAFSVNFLCLFLLVQAAPTKALDSKTLLQNGQQAQGLNVQFQKLNLTDPCNNGEKACLSGGVSVCQNGTWNDNSGKCSKSQACFALPSTTKEGTLVTCTTENKALSAFQATGVEGGIFGTGSEKTTTTTQDDDQSDKTGDTAAEADGKSKDSEAPPARPTKTVTIVVGTQTTTLAPVTRTLTPEQAVSELMKIMNGGVTIVGRPRPTTTSHKA